MESRLNNQWTAAVQLIQVYSETDKKQLFIFNIFILSLVTHMTVTEDSEPAFLSHFEQSITSFCGLIKIPDKT